MGEGGEAGRYTHFRPVDGVDEEPHWTESSNIGVNTTSNPICENGEEERQKIYERKDSEYKYYYRSVLLTSVNWWTVNE